MLGILQRDGDVRLKHIPPASKEHIHGSIRENVDISAARLMTDEHFVYRTIGREFANGHEAVAHGKGEYSRKPDITTNTIEGFFSLLKRGVYGTFHSVSAKHLHRYLAEFAFRYNQRAVDDGARTVAAVQRSNGKRLTGKALRSAR